MVLPNNLNFGNFLGVVRDDPERSGKRALNNKYRACCTVVGCAAIRRRVSCVDLRTVPKPEKTKK